jgi:itaconyl-CoA hydratase
MTSDGPFFEDFHVGDVIHHPMGRTITETDNTWFTLLTCNTNQVHFNQDYAEKTFPEPPFHGRLLVDAMLTLAIVVGLSVEQTSKNEIMLGLTDLKVPNPTFPGDTVYSESTVLNVRSSKSRPKFGIVEISTRGFKPDGTAVVEFRRTIMIRKTGPRDDRNPRSHSTSSSKAQKR